MRLSGVVQSHFRATKLIAQTVLSLEEQARCAAEQDLRVYRSLRQRLRLLLRPDLSGIRVLDFGAGAVGSLVLLLAEEGADVVGLDLCPPLRDGVLARVRWQARERYRRAPVALAEFLRERRALRHLRRLSGARIDPASLTLLRYEGGRLPFPDESFDCVISNAVLQEIPADSLAFYAGELARVLRPGGSLDLSWHNFFSWSGNYLGAAHNRRHPWGHLRGGRYDTTLNRCRPEDVLAAFRPHFQHLELLGHDHDHHIRGRDPAYRPEGEEYLTPALEAGLAAYPRDLLLTADFRPS